MAENTATLILWRDIPTQITQGKGRRATKRMLADRFMVAVDKSAMNGEAKSADDYLEDWRKIEVDLPQSDQPLEDLAQQIEAAYPTIRLAEISAQGGRDAQISSHIWSKT